MNTIRPMNTIYTSNVDPHKSSLSALHALKTILFNLFLLLKWLKTTGHLSELYLYFKVLVKRNYIYVNKKGYQKIRKE